MNNRSNSPFFFKAVFNTAPVGLAVIDEHGLFVDINKKLYSMFGYNGAELASQPFTILFTSSIQQDVTTVQQTVLQTGQPAQISLQGKTKEGVLIDLSLSFDPFTDENENRLIVTSFTDISLRKEQEQKIFHSQEEMELILNNTEEMFMVIDKEYKVVNYNKATKERAKAILGKELKLGDSLLTLAEPERYSFVIEVYEKVLAGQTIRYKHMVDRGLGIEHYQLTYSPVFDADGSCKCFMVTVRDITVEEKVLNELKVNEQQLNLIYNSTTGIIFLLGVENNCEDFRFISMNNSGLETIGFTQEYLFNKPVQEIIPEPSFSLVRSKYKEAIESGKSVIWQEETPYPTGTKTGIVTVTPIYDNEGNCVRLVGSVNDITELKETERSLAISRQQYKSLFDQNPDAVYSLDLEGNFTNFNPGLEKLLECSRQDIIQTATFVPFCHPDDLEATFKYFQKAQTGDAQTYDVRAITFNGNLKYLSVINIPIMVDGIVTGVYGIAKDITSEQHALTQLELSNERYEYAAKATNDVIWDWNIITNKVVRAGGGFRIMFGYDEYETSNDNLFWIEKIHPADADAMLEKRKLALDDPKQDFWEDEYRFLRSNGEYAFVYERGYIFRSENGTAVRMIGATKDITEQKMAELQLKELYGQLEKRAAQLQTSNTDLERFAYIASHDLQEPLRMISSFLQLLEKKYLDSIDGDGREYIRFAVDGSLRMKHLVNDLLDYSRISTSKQNLENVHIDLVMNDVLQNLGLQIKEKKAVIKTAGLPLLQVADKTQMIQLFQNLLSNALKYSGNKQPRIEVTAVEQDDQWLFSVKDNGIGFDERFTEKIFVIFHRLHSKSEFSGTGMGLAICKKIIDRHGGEIYAKSMPGEGSTFWFTIKKYLIPE